MLTLYPEPHVMFGGGNCRRAGARENDDHVLDVLLDDLQRVEQRGTGDDRRAMLIIVKDGNAHRLSERLLDVEAIGSANVLEVDSTNRRLEQLAELDDVIGA